MSEAEDVATALPPIAIACVRAALTPGVDIGHAQQFVWKACLFCEQRSPAKLSLQAAGYSLADSEAEGCEMSEETRAALAALVGPDPRDAEIEALTAEAGRLRAALRYYAGLHENPNDGPWGVNSKDFGTVAIEALAQEDASS